MFRATLRTPLSGGPRLLLSALAVVLGATLMSAGCAASDPAAPGKARRDDPHPAQRFQELITTVNQKVDVQVTARDTAPGQVDGGRPTAPGQVDGGRPTALLDESTVNKLAAIPGVAKVVAGVYADGARVVGNDGTVVASDGPAHAGIGWSDQAQLREGRPPHAADEVAIDAGLAKKTGYVLGDRVDVLTFQPAKAYVLVGIFGYPGGRDSLAGETTVAFTMSTAQEVLLGARGKYTHVNLTAVAGVSGAELKQRVADAMGADFVVRTGP